MASPPIRRLAWVEFRRLFRWRALFVTVGLAGFGLTVMRVPSSIAPPILGVWSAVDSPLLTLGGVLVAIIVASGSLAEDRRTKYTRLVLARGYSRRAYVLAKALAVALSTGLVTCLGLIGLLALAKNRLPPDAWMMATWRDLLLPLALLALATSGLALTGLLAGVVSKSVYIAHAAPLVVMVAAAVLMSNSPLSPAVHIEAWRDVLRPRPFVPPVRYAFLYWVAFGGLMALAGGEIFARTDKD